MALARGRAHHVSLDFVVINYLTGGARSEDNAVVQQVPTPHLRLLLPPAPRRCIIASKKRAREVVRETRKEIDALSLSLFLSSPLSFLGTQRYEEYKESDGIVRFRLVRKYELVLHKLIESARELVIDYNYLRNQDNCDMKVGKTKYNNRSRGKGGGGKEEEREIIVAELLKKEER